MTLLRHYQPKTVSAWDVDVLARSTRDRVKHAEDRQAQASILRACEAAGCVRANWSLPTAAPGDFAMVDGRWHRIEAVVASGRSRRLKFELQDVACPDMPRHRVAWSEIQRVARIRHSSEPKA